MNMETLGKFFAQIRGRTHKRDFLSRAELESRGLAWLKAETKRRRYSSVKNWRTAGAQDWITHFLLVQEKERPLSLREVARRSGVSARVIWKLEHGEGVSAETVKSAFVKGLALPANSRDVRHALTLWAAQHTTTEAGHSLDKLAGWREGGMPEDDATFLRRGVPLFLALTPDEREQLLEAVVNPRVMEALPALVKLAKLNDKVSKADGERLNRKSPSGVIRKAVTIGK